MILLALVGRLVPGFSGPERAKQFEVVEYQLHPQLSFTNPYDPDDISVDATCRGPRGESIKVPAFWDGSTFCVRFCPPTPGRWLILVSAKSGGRSEEEPARDIMVSGSTGDGFVERSPTSWRYLQTSGRRPFFPIGLNLCWPDASGLASYARRFDTLSSVGGNFARIWMTQERRLETQQTGLGRYDQAAATFYDGIFRLAQARGIRLMLTLDDYRVLTKTDYFNAHWAESPYNAANGGPLREPTEFFGDPRCQRLYRQRLRYLVARYSAFTSLAAWEIFNEQDNISEPGVPTEWFRSMTNELARLDPYHHLITTSYSWRDKKEVWESPALGLTQRHLYGQGDTTDFVDMIIDNSRKLDAYRKPHLIGEFGITWKEPDLKLDVARRGTPLHDALWASLMTGDAGGALTWWWDNYLEPANLWNVFVGISRFMRSEDLGAGTYEPVRLDREGLTVVGLRDNKSGRGLYWVHDPGSTWKADAAGTKPKTWRGAHIHLPDSRLVRWEAWDTRTGNVIGSGQGRQGEISLPPFQRDIALKVR